MVARVPHLVARGSCLVAGSSHPYSRFVVNQRPVQSICVFVFYLELDGRRDEWDTPTATIHNR